MVVKTTRKRILLRRIYLDFQIWWIWASALLFLPLLSLTSPGLFVSAGKILVVGATGTTGIRALRGLLDVYDSSNLILLTRDTNKPLILQLKEMGFGVIQADLENEPLLRKQLLRRFHDDIKQQHLWEGCYIHSTSSDTPDLDVLEVSRAQNLCPILMDIAKQQNRHVQEKDNNGASSTEPFVVVYNSAAAPPDHGVRRIAQKHQVEDVFKSTILDEDSITSQPELSPSSSSLLTPTSQPLVFVSLRANIFMEELWKDYTRPSILGGKYPLPLNGWTPIYLTSVRDMGRLAGLWIRHYGVMIGNANPRTTPTRISPPGCVVIQNVAGDLLRGPQIAKAFGQAQGNPCQHLNNSRALTKRNAHLFPALCPCVMLLESIVSWG
jgi:hypothetical protein